MDTLALLPSGSSVGRFGCLSEGPKPWGPAGAMDVWWHPDYICFARFGKGGEVSGTPTGITRLSCLLSSGHCSKKALTKKKKKKRAPSVWFLDLFLNFF